MNREAWDKFFERGILALVLAILVFGPLAMGAVGTWQFLVIQALTVGVMLLWGLRLWISPKPQLLWPPICWVVLAFTLYGVARYLTADIEYVARQQLVQVLVCAFLFWAVVNNLYRQEFSQAISFTLIFLAMGISGYAAYQFFGHSTRVWNLYSTYVGRGMGTYISPNDLAGFLEMLLPLAVAYVLAGRMKVVTRILLGYAALVILVGVAVTFSRGGWVATGLGLVAVLFFLACHRHFRIPAMLLLVVLAASGTFLFTKYLSKSLSYKRQVVDTLHETPGEVLYYRRDMWLAAVEMWRDHFWWGVGPGHYDYRFREYRLQNMQLRPGHAHNDYLNLLADWGTVGGIIVLSGMALFAIGLVRTRKYVRRSDNEFSRGQSNRYAFFVGATGGLLALSAHSFVDFNLHIPANAVAGITLLAILSSNLRFATERYWCTARLPVRTVVTILILAGMAGLGWQGWRRGHEEIWLARAEKLPIFSPQRAGALENAFEVEPENFTTAYDIADCYRTESFHGGEHYEELAKTAMKWYKRSWLLNRYDGYSYMGYGMCLDWLGHHAEAGKYFNTADALDPNGYYTAAFVGWHYVQIRDYAAAKPWLERSLHLGGQENPVAESYLKIAEQKLAANASGQAVLLPGY